MAVTRQQYKYNFCGISTNNELTDETKEVIDMTGTFRHIMETQYKINGRFQTQDVMDFGVECTWETVYQVTCAETLKWFRKIGSKQRVTKTVKNGKHIITVFSYAPHDDKLRHKIVFEEV